MTCSRFAILFLLTASGLGHAAERFEAMFADGSRVEADEILEWDNPGTEARLGERTLFSEDNPVRWIMDHERPAPPLPKAYVEFEGGDRLPGEVISYASGLDNPYEIVARHFVVKPSIDLQPPDVTGQVNVRVALDWVRRIVWEPVTNDGYQPGTIWLRSRKPITFRSLRWTAEGVTVLTTEGLKNVAMTDLAEIHLPRQNAWTAYFDQVSVLSPSLNSRLMQLEATDGGVYTTSFERHQARHFGDRNRGEPRFQLIQPAWSLDSLWLRFRTIRVWRFFAPHEVPLTRFSPDKFVHTPVFGGALDWKLNLNAQSGPLRSTQARFGWGFGVHGSSQLDFRLPAIVRSIRTKYGLDRSVESGGCVNVEVLAGQQMIAKQSHLIGAATVHETGWLDIPPSQGERSVSLKTDLAHEGRPAGSDPYDVRDLLNWYEPEVGLDRMQFEAEVAERGSARVSGLSGWTISPETARAMRVANQIDTTDSRDPQFRLTARSTNGAYTLTRKVQIRHQDRWLAIVASRYGESSTPAKIAISFDGRPVGGFDIPVRSSMTDPDPILVPLENLQGKMIQVEAVATPTDENSWIDWRGFSVRTERPGLLTIFEDEKSFVDRLDAKNSRVEIDTGTNYSGTASLKVMPVSAFNPVLPGLNATISEHPRLGQYRYLVFAWKKPTGKTIQLRLANRGRFGNDLSVDESTPAITDGPFTLRRTQQWDQRGRRFRYSYEQGVASTDPPNPLWMKGDLPSDWQLVQRDLFNDFGAFVLTGISFHCPDGDAAWFDHLYLARTTQDVESLAPPQK